LIKGILEDKLMESTVSELELYLGRGEELEEGEEIEEVGEEKKE
jgi:hypothetical protein